MAEPSPEKKPRGTARVAFIAHLNTITAALAQGHTALAVFSATRRSWAARSAIRSSSATSAISARMVWYRPRLVVRPSLPKVLQPRPSPCRLRWKDQPISDTNPPAPAPSSTTETHARTTKPASSDQAPIRQRTETTRAVHFVLTRPIPCRPPVRRPPVLPETGRFAMIASAGRSHRTGIGLVARMATPTPRVIFKLINACLLIWFPAHRAKIPQKASDYRPGIVRLSSESRGVGAGSRPLHRSAVQNKNAMGGALDPTLPRNASVAGIRRERAPIAALPLAKRTIRCRRAHAGLLGERRPRGSSDDQDETDLSVGNSAGNLHHLDKRPADGQRLPHALGHRLPDILLQLPQDRLDRLQPAGLPAEHRGDLCQGAGQRPLRLARRRRRQRALNCGAALRFVLAAGPPSRRAVGE